MDQSCYDLLEVVSDGGFGEPSQPLDESEQIALGGGVENKVALELVAEGGVEVGVEVDGLGQVGVGYLIHELFFLLEQVLLVAGEDLGDKFLAVELDIVETGWGQKYWQKEGTSITENENFYCPGSTLLYIISLLMIFIFDYVI